MFPAPANKRASPTQGVVQRLCASALVLLVSVSVAANTACEIHLEIQLQTDKATRLFHLPDICPSLQVSLHSYLPGLAAAPASQPPTASGSLSTGIVPSPLHPAQRLEVNAGRSCVS